MNVNECARHGGSGRIIVGKSASQGEGRWVIEDNLKL